MKADQKGDNQESHQVQAQSQNKNHANSRKVVHLSNTDMLQLIDDQQNFVGKIVTYNQLGIECYASENFEKSILYLQQAEKVLQYAASCGKTIDRFLIISTLQNEAASYQKLLQLPKSYDYMQAIIFNMKTYFEQYQNINLYCEETISKESPTYKIISSNFHRKICTVVYHLQFAAICSQIDKHQLAIQMVKKGLKLLGQVFRGFQSWVKNRDDGKKEGKIQDLLRMLGKHCSGIDRSEVAHMCKTVRALVKKTRQHPSQEKHYHKLKRFSIGQVMQIHPISVQQSSQYLSIETLSSPPQFTRTCLYTSICYYTIATQLRLIAKKDPLQAESTHQFQKSKIYHLFAIKISLQFAPFFSDYHQHILRSFKMNYHIDLNAQLLEYLEEEKLKQSLLDGDSLVLQGSLVQSQQIKSSIRVVDKKNLRTRRMSSQQIRSEGKNKVPLFKLNLKNKKKRKSSNKDLISSNCMALSRQTLHKQRSPNIIQNMNQNRKTLGNKSQKKFAFVGSTSRTKLGKPKNHLGQQKIKKGISNEKAKDMIKKSENIKDTKDLNKEKQKQKQKQREKQKNRKRILEEYMTIKDNSIGKKGKKNKKNGECSKSKSKSKGKNKRDDLSTPKSNAYGFKSLRR